MTEPQANPTEPRANPDPSTASTRIPSLGPRGEGWVAIQVVLFGLLAVAPLVDGSPAPADLRPVLAVLGLFLVVVGLGIAGKGLIDLRQALTPLPHPRDDAELVETGVYGRVRHPIYGGIVLGAFGWSCLTGSPAALALSLVLLLFFRLKSGREEAWLRQRYPGYEAYSRRTRRMIPFVY
jgi:protein-S-isoprenylcysteine O-methyltransferase Ste14